MTNVTHSRLVRMSIKKVAFRCLVWVSGSGGVVLVG